MGSPNMDGTSHYYYFFGVIIITFTTAALFCKNCDFNNFLCSFGASLLNLDDSRSLFWRFSY